LQITIFWMAGIEFWIGMPDISGETTTNPQEVMPSHNLDPHNRHLPRLDPHYQP